MSSISNLIKSLGQEPWATLLVLADAAEQEQDSSIAHLAPGLRWLAENKRFPFYHTRNKKWWWYDETGVGIDPEWALAECNTLPRHVYDRDAVSYFPKLPGQKGTATKQRVCRTFDTSDEAFIAAATAYAEWQSEKEFL